MMIDWFHRPWSQRCSLTSPFCFGPTCHLCIFKQTWKTKFSSAGTGLPWTLSEIATGVFSFLTSLPPIPLHQKSFCQHHIRRDKVRNSSPTLSLWLYPALLFPLVWKRKNPAIHSPRLSPYALLFLVPRIHLQSHLEPQRSAITKKSSIALLVKHSGHLLLSAFIFNGKALKCRTPPVPLKMYLFPCWMNYSTEEKNITFQCMNHSYLYSSPFLLFVFFTYILLNYVWPNTKRPSQNPESVAIVMIVPLVPCAWNEVPCVQGTL